MARLPIRKRRYCHSEQLWFYYQVRAAIGSREARVGNTSEMHISRDKMLRESSEIRQSDLREFVNDNAYIYVCDVSYTCTRMSIALQTIKIDAVLTLFQLISVYIVPVTNPVPIHRKIRFCSFNL